MNNSYYNKDAGLLNLMMKQQQKNARILSDNVYGNAVDLVNQKSIGNSSNLNTIKLNK